jgi:hypothetical protein
MFYMVWWHGTDMHVRNRCGSTAMQFPKGSVQMKCFSSSQFCWLLGLVDPSHVKASVERPCFMGISVHPISHVKSDVCMMSVNGMTNAELRVFYYVLSLRSVRRAHGRLLITRRDEHVPFPNSNKNHFRRPHLPGFCRFHLCFCSWKSTLRLG